MCVPQYSMLPASLTTQIVTGFKASYAYVKKMKQALYYQNALTKVAASSKCQSIDGRLLSVHNENELSELKALTDHIMWTSTVWTSAVDIGGVWKWDDGQPVPSFMWNSGEPSGKIDLCAFMYSKSLNPFHQNNVPCDITTHSLCIVYV
jgi:hypothetical protein